MPARRLRLALASAVLALVPFVATACGDSSEEPFRIGVLTDCTGLLAETHDWSLAAAELPLLQRGGRLVGKGPASGVRDAKVAGRRAEIVEACSETGVYGRLISETRRLVDVEHVDAVVGGFGGSDGIVLRELARRYPTVPFLVVQSAPREVTVHTPAANLYRFIPDAEQDKAGLATYAYRTLGWRHAAVVAEDTPNGWGGVAAFAAEFCALGGRVERVWTPAYGPPNPLLGQVPTAVDGVLVLAAYGFGTPVAFIRAYLARHADAERSLLLGLWAYPPLDTADYAKLWPEARGVVARLSGFPDLTSARNRAYHEAFARAFPGLPPGVAGNLTVLPYHDSVQALLQALEDTNGEVGAGRGKLRTALASLRIATPGGPMRLDGNRQAVVEAKLVRIEGVKDGAPAVRTVRTIAGVDATLGGLLAPDVAPGLAPAECRRGALPPWAK